MKRARAASSASSCAATRSTRPSWSRTRATSCRRTVTIWSPPSAAASRCGRRAAIPLSPASSSTSRRSCSAAAAGPSGWRSWPTPRAPATAQRRTWISVHLVERAAASHAIWGAALVPEETRRTLAADPKLGDAASISTLYGGIDLGKGLEAEIKADVATAEGAKSLASKVTESLRDAKRNPQVLMLGLGPIWMGCRPRRSIARSRCAPRSARRLWMT